MKEDQHIYVPLTSEELDHICRSLATAAASDTGTDLIVLGMSLEGRAIPADQISNTLTGAMHALRSYQYGNVAPDLASDIADTCEALLGQLGGHSAPPNAIPSST